MAVWKLATLNIDLIYTEKLTFAEEVVTYLATQSLGTKGTDLFYNHAPEGETISPMTVVIGTGGAGNPHGGLPWAAPTIQVLVEASTYDAAARQSAKIHNVLHGMFRTQLTHNFVLTSSGEGLPQSLGKTELGRWRVSGNYSFETYVTSDSGEASTGYQGDKSPDIEA